jgi:enoyl-CoA hydratase/carnithine racemase
VTTADVTIDMGDDFVAVVEIHRAPNNFFDVALIKAVADAFAALDDDPSCRAIVLCADGKHFCAGANFNAPTGDRDASAESGGSLYVEAARLFGARTPVVAAVQGAAIGGGLGLACAADFRVASPEARFAANFARLGFHPGFGLTVTLPLIVGHQRAIDLLYRGRRVTGEEALAIGLADQLVPADELREAAHALAADIAQSGPLSLQSIKRAMRGHLVDEVQRATALELAEQDRLRVTNDFAEGVAAYAERRPAKFTGT